MAILTAMFDREELQRINPAVRALIVQGVQAGAKLNAALEAKQRFSPSIAKGLTAEAKIAVADFKKSLKG